MAEHLPGKVPWHAVERVFHYWPESFRVDVKILVQWIATRACACR